MSKKNRRLAKRTLFEVSGPALIEVTGDAMIRFATRQGTLTIKDSLSGAHTTTSTSLTQLAVVLPFEQLIVDIERSDLPSSKKKKLIGLLRRLSPEKMLKFIELARGIDWLWHRLTDILKALSGP